MSTTSKVNTQAAAGTNVELDVMTIRKSGGGPKIKAFFVFGEHARELITGEAAVGLARTLCGQGPNAAQAAKVLETTEFVFVPNANPVGRKEVEDGFYCKRTNEDGIDLNRNWSDEHRDTDVHPGDEMYPGTAAFSEPETQMLKELIDQENPDIYLSVHSGAFLLGMPYGYDQNSGEPRDEAAMNEALRPISEKHCGGGCPFGNLAQMIKYDNPGCDIDYVYDKLKTPYVFTWEIFVGEEFRERYIEEARMRRGVSVLDPADTPAPDAVPVATTTGAPADAAPAAQKADASLFAVNSDLSTSSATDPFSEPDPSAPFATSDGFLAPSDGLSFAQRKARKATRKAQVRSRTSMGVRGPENKEEVTSCMDQFNPQSEEETQGVVDNWTGAFLDLATEVSAKKLGTTTSKDGAKEVSSATSGTAAPSASDALMAEAAAGKDPFA